MSTLGPTQILVLCALDAIADDGAPLTPAEIADYMAERMKESHPGYLRRRTSEAEAANAALRRLLKHAMVERLGKASNGARCWAITPAGRQHLADMQTFNKETPS